MFTQMTSRTPSRPRQRYVSRKRHRVLRHEPLEPRRLLDAGALDPNFGSGGTVTLSLTNYQDSIRAMAVQTDGKIVCAGFDDTYPAHDFMVARYLPDGTLDPTFGPGGRGWVDNDFGGTDDALQGVAIQPDGKIVAAGLSGTGPSSDFAIIRYDSAGNLDTSFGTGGTVFTDFGGGNSQDSASAVLVQPDGKIVVGGYTIPGGTGPVRFAMARYDAAGNLDPTFGIGGRVITPVQETGAIVSSLAWQSDGKLVAAGTSRLGDQNFALARYMPDGSLDATFGSGATAGVVTINLGGDEVGQGVALLADGRMILAGYRNASGLNTGILIRLNGDGSIDGTFGVAGIASTTIGGQSYAVHGLAIQQNGRIVTVGAAGTYGTTRFAASRHDADGTLDTSFGTGGTVVTNFPSSTETAYAVVILPHGRIVAGGDAGFYLNSDIALAGYVGDPANRPPVAEADAYSVPEDGLLSVSAPGLLRNDSDPDGDPLTVQTTLVTAPAHGTLTSFSADGSFTYRPFANFRGTDSFVYRVSDGYGGTSDATVTITVQSVQQQIDLLIIEVKALVGPGKPLSTSEGRSLTTKLDAAKNSANRGDLGACISKLQAFVNEVNALVKSKRLTSAQAQPLIEDAQAAIISAGPGKSAMKPRAFAALSRPAGSRVSPRGIPGAASRPGA